MIRSCTLLLRAPALLPRVCTFMLIAGVVALGGCAGAPNRPLSFVSGDGPTYPVEARAQKLEGWVVVEYGVNTRGQVVAPRVIESEPPGIFDQAALDAVTRWQYQPRIVRGEPTTVEGVQSRVTFKLGEPDEYVVE